MATTMGWAPWTSVRRMIDRPRAALSGKLWPRRIDAASRFGSQSSPGPIPRHCLDPTSRSGPAWSPAKSLELTSVTWSADHTRSPEWSHL